MDRFWSPVIRPILEAAEPRVVVEVGAAQGAHTRRLAPYCAKRDAVLHVVDPQPDFDPEAARWARTIELHRDESLAVLPELGAVDVALLDGDHNWYTVINELRALTRTARDADRPAPVIVCHDVDWPYGRRDMYYEPGRIPSKHRRAWKRAGLKPGRDRLVADGGLNYDLANAEHAGGPANGVLTAVEDFLAETDEEFELAILPVLHGLGILAPAARLEASPALAAQLERWRTVRGWRTLAGLAEDTRQRELANAAVK